MTYNEIVEDCFFYPKHVGVLDISQPFTCHARTSQSKQGVLIDLYVASNKNKTIQRACFKATGHPYIIAGLEWICREIEGQELFHLPILNYQVIVNALQIPMVYYPLAIQVENVYQQAITLLLQYFEENK